MSNVNKWAVTGFILGPAILALIILAHNFIVPHLQPNEDLYYVLPAMLLTYVSVPISIVTFFTLKQGQKGRTLAIANLLIVLSYPFWISFF